MKTLTLPRRRIIKKKGLFQRAFAEGRVITGRLLIVRALKQIENGAKKDSANVAPSEIIESLPTRIGIAAGKKIGCAVQRNRAKRLLREAYRLEQQKIKSGLWLILVAKQAVLSAKTDEIRAELLYLLKKGKLLNQAEI